jgi:hypothetical protein
MATRKFYKDPPEAYEKKLHRVMSRIGSDHYDYDYGRRDAWVEFFLYGRAYRFEQNIDKARELGKNLYNGSDCFAQVVRTIEDLARAGENGIFTLQTILNGLPALPPPQVIPDYFQLLNFDRMPEDPEEVRTRFKELAKIRHPDAGGTVDAFQDLQKAFQKALEHFGSHE